MGEWGALVICLFFHSFSFFHYLIGPTSCAYAKPAQVGTLCTCYVPVPLGDDGGAQKVRMIPGASCLAQPSSLQPLGLSLSHSLPGTSRVFARVRLLQYHALMRAPSPAGSSRSIASTAQDQPNLSHVASTICPRKLLTARDLGKHF